MGNEIEYKRGDTKPIVFLLWEDKAAGTALDIAGFTFRFTVNKKKEPVAGTDEPEFTLVGEIVTPTTDGKVRFLPSSSNSNLEPTNEASKIEYYYDFEVTDAEGLVGTEIIDKFKLIQDISK